MNDPARRSARDVFRFERHSVTHAADPGVACPLLRLQSGRGGSRRWPRSSRAPRRCSTRRSPTSRFRGSPPTSTSASPGCSGSSPATSSRSPRSSCWAERSEIASGVGGCSSSARCGSGRRRCCAPSHPPLSCWSERTLQGVGGALVTPTSLAAHAIELRPRGSGCRGGRMVRSRRPGRCHRTAARRVAGRRARLALGVRVERPDGPGGRDRGARRARGGAEERTVGTLRRQWRAPRRGRGRPGSRGH